MSGRFKVWLSTTAALVFATVAMAEAPVAGGHLSFTASGEPTSLDCASFTSVTQLQYLAPHYSTLLTVDPSNYPNIIPGVAKDWSISPDGLVYEFKLHENVKFHDGKPLTAADVKATFERISSPKEGVVSVRKAQYTKLKSIEVDGEYTVRFNLSEPAAGFLSAIAAPWNCLYSAERLASDPTYPRETVYGSGPFKFDEYSVGAHWRGSKFEDYFVEGKPYLDSFEAVVVTPQTMVNAIAGKQVNGNFRVISEPEKKRIEAARGDEVEFQSTPATSTTVIVVNTRRKPFDDVRVRKALSLAIDRETGLKVLGGYAQKFPNVIFREGHELAPTVEEIKSVPGFSGDMRAQREEAKRLLAEAGVTDLKFSLLSPSGRVPWEPVGIFLIDQWRQIGVTVTYDPQQMASQIGRLQSGDFDLGIDFNAPAGDDPSEVMAKFVPGGAGNWSGMEDQELVDLYTAQDSALDTEERKALVKKFEQRFVDLQYFITTFNTEREIVLDKTVRGWRVPPSYSVGLDMSNVWLAK